MAYGLVVALADEEIVFDHATKGREREHDFAVLGRILELDIECQAVLLDPEHEPVRPARRAYRSKTVGLQKIVDRDIAFLFDLASAAHNSALVQRDRREPE